jgi:hypothetical protein
VIEVYNNYMHGKRIDHMVGYRGGSALIYNNYHISTAASTGIIDINEEEYETAVYTQRAAWPAEDQVNNSFIWGNTLDGVGQTADRVVVIWGADYLAKDQDYFLHAPCAAADETDAYGNACTHGKSTWTGLNGASDTYPTDGLGNGTEVFTATGDNAHYPYTPFTCPHPLVEPTAALECDVDSQGVGVAGGYGLTKTSTYFNVTPTVSGNGSASPMAVHSILSGGNASELTATPNNSGNVFSGWSGCGCTGTSTCTPTNVTEACAPTATFKDRYIFK